MVNNYSLPNGESVDLTDYEIVLFMQSECPFCRRFDPKLRDFVKSIGIMLAVYTLNDAGDKTFPDAKPASGEIVDTLFAHLEIVTPTTFLVNRKTDRAELLAQGDMSVDEFTKLFETSLARMKERSE